MKNLFILFLSISSLHITFAQDISWSSNRPENTLIEGCGNGEFVISNEGDEQVDLEIQLSGNYSEEDLETEFENSITIDAGDTYTLSIAAVEDNNTENDENVVIAVVLGNETILSADLSLEDEISLSLDPNDNFTVCPDMSIPLTAESNGKINWTPGNFSGNTYNLILKEETTVMVSASQGSCFESEEVTITPTTFVNINTQGDTLYLCKDEDPVTVSATSFESNNIEWSSTGFLFTPVTNSQVQIDPNSSGWLYATTELGNCIVTDTLYVQVDSLPEMEFDTIPNKDPYCPGEIVTMYGMKLQQDLYPDAVYEWTPETGVISDVNKANLTISTTDTITFVRTTENNACVSTDSITLNVDNPPIELNFTDTVVCPNQRVEIVLENPETFEDYEWSPEEKVSCTKCPNPSVTVTEATTIELMLETEHCPTSASVNLNIQQPQNIDITGDGPVCPGEEVQLTVAQRDNYESFSWDGNVDFSCTDCPEPSISSSEVHSATLTAVDAEGCLGIGNYIYDVYELPSIAIQTDQQEVPQGESVVANLVTNQSDEFTDIIWEVNGQTVDGSDITNTLTMPEENNTIRVTALTEEGCPVSASIEIETTEPSYFIPNAFTPRGRANNIFRVVINGNIMVKSMRVFARWGNLVFSTTSSEGWDGTKDGELLPSDTYVYLIEIEYPDGTVEEEKGEITLLN